MSDQPNNIVTIGGRQFAASCLTLGVMRRNVGALKTVMDMRSQSDGAHPILPSAEEFDAIIAIVGASIAPVEPLPGTMNFGSFVDALEFKSVIVELLGALRKVMELSGYRTPAKEGTGESGETTNAAS